MHGDHVRPDRTEESCCAGRDDRDKDSVAVQTSSRVFALAVTFAALMGAAVSAAQSSPSKAPAAPPAANAPAPANTAAPASAPAAATAPAPAPAAKVPPPEPQGYTYDPQGRRDPFVSLLRRGGDVPRASGGTRPNGLA